MTEAAPASGARLAVLLGAAIIAASGLFVIWREHRLGLERPRARVKARTSGPA